MVIYGDDVIKRKRNSSLKQDILFIEFKYLHGETNDVWKARI